MGWDDWQHDAARWDRILWMRSQHSNTHVYTHLKGKSLQHGWSIVVSLTACLTKASQICEYSCDPSQVAHIHAHYCHDCTIVTPSSHWVVMALVKTWRWRIIATWICERKAKSCGGITSLSFCFSFSKTRTRLSSEMQSSPSLGWITVFWIKLGCCWTTTVTTFQISD